MIVVNKTQPTKASVHSQFGTAEGSHENHSGRGAETLSLILV